MLPDSQLKDIQGYVASGYDYASKATYFFLQFKDPKKSKEWLEKIIPKITTTERWPVDENGRLMPPKVVLHLGFSHAGLAAFGLPESALYSAPREFVDGMANRKHILGDTGASDPENWEIGGPNNEPVHALMLLHATEDTYTDAYKTHQKLFEDSKGGVVVIREENAFREDSGREQFGFSDGVGQPIVKGLVFTSKPVVSGNIVNTGEFVLGYLNEFGVYSPTMVVPVESDPKNILPGFPDPQNPGYRDFGRNGMFLVYRKLQQDVAAFWQAMEANTFAPTEKGKKAEILWLAAKLMGRWPSGAPLVLSPDHDDPSLARADDFLYERDDPEGFRCPIGSHVRRANPRDSLQNISWGDSIHTSNTRRILRRARLYGESLFPQSAFFDENDPRPVGLKDDGVARGVHFFAINAETDRQFEFIQKIWINNAGFNNLYDNKDAFVGNNDNGNGVMTIPQSPVRRQVSGLGRFVDVRGGGYFFMPGMAAMRYMVEC